MKKKYIFQSKRLGFRNWLAEDLPTMAKINADNEVMAYFPAPVNVAGTSAFIERMQAQYLSLIHI